MAGKKSKALAVILTFSIIAAFSVHAGADEDDFPDESEEITEISYYESDDDTENSETEYSEEESPVEYPEESEEESSEETSDDQEESSDDEESSEEQYESSSDEQSSESEGESDDEEEESSAAESESSVNSETTELEDENIPQDTESEVSYTPQYSEISYEENFNINENISERSTLVSENSEIEKKIKLTDKEIKQKKEELAKLQSQITTLRENIKTSNEKIAALNSEISIKQAAYDEKTDKIQDILELLKVRLRKLHTSGDTSDLELILGAKSFSDLIDKAEMIKNMARYDTDIINSIRSQMNEISEYQKSLIAQKSQVETEKKKLENDTKSINELLDKNTKLVNELLTEKDRLSNEKKANEEKQQVLKKALEDYRRRQAERTGAQIIVTPPTDGSYLWPCPGYTYLTATFDEERSYGIHGGIDIAGAGIYGAKVIACCDGYVFSSYDGCPHDYGKYESCGCSGGFGNYIMVDHGGGKISVYAHLSGLAVTTGQTVTAGQLIGYVGTTGYSTGPHLHFETRYEDTRYDPLTEYS